MQYVSMVCKCERRVLVMLQTLTTQHPTDRHHFTFQFTEESLNITNTTETTSCSVSSNCSTQDTFTEEQTLTHPWNWSNWSEFMIKTRTNIWIKLTSFCSASQKLRPLSHRGGSRCEASGAAAVCRSIDRSVCVALMNKPESAAAALVNRNKHTRCRNAWRCGGPLSCGDATGS